MSKENESKKIKQQLLSVSLFIILFVLGVITVKGNVATQSGYIDTKALQIITETQEKINATSVGNSSIGLGVKPGEKHAVKPTRWMF
jgi:hypothetical protein